MADTPDHQSTLILRTAEALFTEFYQNCTSNSRKAAIEVQIRSLLSDPKLWRLWADSPATTQNLFVISQCLNLLGDFVGNFWICWASGEQKEYIKQRLLLYLDRIPVAPLPNFIVTKVLKLLVDIGRNDWPVSYPNFFVNVEELVRDPQRGSLGLRMLKLVSEEFMHPKENLRRGRKEELRAGLAEKIPEILGMLYGVVGPFLEVVKRATSADGTVQLETYRPVIARCVQALHVLNDVLTWMPVKYSLPQELLSALFSLANCDPDDLDLYELATASLSCVGEIAGKTCPNPDMEKTLWSVYEFAFVKLEKVSQDLQGVSELSDSSSEYFQQFVELLRPLLVNHLQRFESHQNFPTMNFLERFFVFTFNMPAFDLFLNCVDIWNDFLDRILTVTSARASATKSAILNSYSAPILALVDRLLMRIQLHFNLAQLEELSEEILRNQVDGVSERDDYFERCIGVVIKAGEILPKEILDKLVARFSELQQVFGRIQSLLRIDDDGTNRRVVLMLEKKSEIRQLHCVLRDLGILSRATASHCGLLTGDLYPVYADRVVSVVQVLLQGLQFLNDSVDCLRNFQAHAPLPRDFVYLHAALYQSLESLFPWLTQFYSTHVHGSTDGLNKLVAAVIKTCLDPILAQADSSVAASSSKTLRSLTKIIRIPGMMELGPIKELFRQLTEVPPAGLAITFWNLSLETQVNLLCSLTNILVLPLSQQPTDLTVWDDRARQHGALVAALTAKYRELSPAQEQTLEVVSMVKSSLELLRGLLAHSSEDPKKSRQIVLASLTPFLNSTVLLLPVFKRNVEERSAVLQFVLSVFSSLKSAFPPELTSPLSDLFEGLFEQFLDPEELLRAFCSSDPVQIESLSTCFELLKLVVCDPAYKAYLPMVIMLCHIVCPALQTLTDIRIEFRTASYELLLSVLTHHWTYFFRSVRMVAGTNGDGIETSLKEEAAEAKDFLVITQCLGAALVQPEISITQTVLQGLNQLHTSRQIFAKAPFEQALRVDFLNALLSMLVNREKELLSEEMYTALFGIVSADVDYFYRQYLPSFLEMWPGLDGLQRGRLYGNLVVQLDPVIFTEQINALTGEIRCFVMYNSVRSL